MNSNKKKRVPISKSVRFEVFKRDLFKCQYCGSEAPNVLLHIDHINPVAKDGGNEITNLVTSCAECNLGKRDVPLDENAALSKARNQMEELQERREQLELMMQWRESLRDLADDTVTLLSDYWKKLAPGFSPNETGKQNIKKWLQKFTVEEITIAMDTAATSYLKFTEKGTVTSESWELAFNKILGICRVNKASEKNPDIKQLYYIRGILRNRIPGYFDDAKALQWLKNARTWDITLEELTEMACSVKNWSGFSSEIGALIQRQREESENE